MFSAISSTNTVNGFLAHKAKRQTTLAAWVFGVLFKDLGINQSGFEFGYGQAISDAFIIGM